MSHSQEDLLAAASRYVYRDSRGVTRFPYAKFMQDFKVPRRKAEALGSWAKEHLKTLAHDKEASDDYGVVRDHVPPEFKDLKKSEFDYQEWLDLAAKHKDLSDRASPHQRHATINIPTDRPIAIAYTADWHLGSVSVDYPAWEKNIRFLMEQPDLYIAVLGDLIENFVRFRSVSAVLSQVVAPKYQRKMLRDIINQMVDEGKLLYATWGNHDWEFSEKNGGESLMDEVYERVPSFADTGIVQLNVGKQRYTNLASHLNKFNSQFNRNHGNKQMYRMEFPADVVITGHNHAPDFETYTSYQDAQELGMGFGGRSIMVKVGTFKTDDTYSKRYYGRPAIMIPTIVYDPRQRDLTVFESAEKAVRYMDALHAEFD